MEIKKVMVLYHDFNCFCNYIQLNEYNVKIPLFPMANQVTKKAVFLAQTAHLTEHILMWLT